MENKRDKLLALGLTVLIALLMGLMLVMVHIAPASASLPSATDPEEQEIFFADIDYNEIYADPTPQVDGEATSAAASDDGGADLTSTSGESVPDLVADKTPKPDNTQIAKPEQTKPAGPTKEEIEEQKRAAIAAKFGKATGLQATNNQAAGSSTAGNAASGDNPTSTGLGLDGRKLQNRPDPGIKNAVGKVWVKVSVNSAGQVTSAAFVRSSGFGSREAEVRQACLEATKKLRYSPNNEIPTQSGTICWNIK
ncbi:MAG: hypothetical protein NC301_00665 [Bacteroides sp.]|nr:hypothetical protein [Bacteroides sp.]MCM1379421.1 hypothetical protein [Bacteroides sp.]MCM1445281.1 hypothetical protein [Prevotella sp.]